jgi:hypothetical protein
LLRPAQCFVCGCSRIRPERRDWFCISLLSQLPTGRTGDSLPLFVAAMFR